MRLAQPSTAGLLFLLVQPLLCLTAILLLLYRGFKALKQIVKLHYKMGSFDKMIKAYK